MLYTMRKDRLRWLTGVDWSSWVGLGDGSRADEDASGFALSSRSQLSDCRGQQHTSICVVTCVTLFNQKLTPLINQSIVTRDRTCPSDIPGHLTSSDTSCYTADPSVAAIVPCCLFEFLLSQTHTFSLSLQVPTLVLTSNGGHFTNNKHHLNSLTLHTTATTSYYYFYFLKTLHLFLILFCLVWVTIHSASDNSVVVCSFYLHILST